jgi:hypothetical protein
MVKMNKRRQTEKWKRKEEKEKTCNNKDLEIFSKLPRIISGQIYLARAIQSYHTTWRQIPENSNLNTRDTELHDFRNFIKY